MKKRNPPDATHRNTRTTRDHHAKLAAKVKVLEAEVKRLTKVVKSHAKMFDEGRWT